MIEKIIKILFLMVLAHGLMYAEEIKMNKNMGIYNLPVTINDAIKLNFVIDTGASHVTIPSDVLKTLIRTGTIQKSDMLGDAKYKLADGSVVKNTVFIIRKMKIGNKYINNVKASASKHENAPLLLGQSALKKLEPWHLDSAKGVLRIGESNKKFQYKLNIGGKSQNIQDSSTPVSKLETYKQNCLVPPTSVSYAYVGGKMVSTTRTDGTACFEIGDIYLSGINVEVDNQKAKYFFEKGCEHGAAKSCGVLAMIHRDGKIVRENHKTGIKYHERACELDKQYCMGLGSYFGWERSNYSKALHYYKKACDAKIGSGCYSVALYYEEGKGVDQNISIAKEQFGKACDMGHLDGCKEYKRLNDKN